MGPFALKLKAFVAISRVRQTEKTIYMCREAEAP